MRRLTVACIRVLLFVLDRVDDWLFFQRYGRYPRRD
jgi:hypothetical protein